MEFPHLKDTNFPNVNGVNVYKYENTFDYARWQGKTSIKLLNVLWNSNYADVPYFESEEERDEWFNEKEGIVKPLESAFIVAPDNSVKIPIPYNDAYNYNYLVVDIPIITSQNEPIDYENEKIRIKRWYYFIDDMSQRSPSTTEVYVSCDYWTTFIHHIQIPYLMLERGHAPMMKTSVESFLNNPIANNEYLLADDFNYGTSNVISESKYFPIGNDKKWVLIASSISPSSLSNIGGGEYFGSSTPPTFSDINNRWGYQLQVNGYDWHYGNGNYSDANLPITAFGHNENDVFNGNYIYAINCTQASSFFNYVAKYAVHFLHAVNACFVVDETMLSFGAAYSLFDYTIYRVTRKNIVENISLEKSDFDFNSKYENITKLYTYPYSVLEITDDNGFTAEVRIENCGSLKLHKEISIGFPYIQYQTFFSGINGNETQVYTWKNLTDTNINKTMWESDFSKFMMKWDIPTFAIQVSQENEYAANNYADIQARRQGAIIDYQNTARFANTTRENIADTMATNTANVAASGVNANTNQGIQNDCNTDVTDLQNDCNNVISGNNRTTASSINYSNNDKLTGDATADIAATVATTLAQNDAVAATTANNNVATASMAGVNLAASTGAAIGQAATGNFGMAANSMSNMASTVAGAHITIQHSNMASLISQSNNNDMASAAANNTTAKLSNAQTCNNSVTTLTNLLNQVNTNKAINTAEDITETTNESARQQTANTVNTNNTNASRTQSTETNNATWNRNAGIVAAQDILRQKQREEAAKYAANRLGTPTFETNYSGDAFPDAFQRRGVRVNVRTQSKAAIAQTGDSFLRFGYALHRNWDMSNGFHYGKHFTFWKAEDIWINDGSGVANIATRTIGDILMKGVTVWRNPEEIGMVGIYDNI